MIVNYFVTALRTIKKDKQHFFLNVVGFSIGLAAAILMALFAQHELSYDKHQPDSERVYIAHTDYTSIGLQAIALSSYRNAETLKSHSQVEDIFRLVETNFLSRLNQGVSELVQVDDNYYRLSNFYAATSNILDFIKLDIIAGDINQTLGQPGQLALSEGEAKRLFGETQVIGRLLKHEQGQYRIGAVFKNLAENSHVKFDSLTHMPAQFIQDGQGYVYYKLLANTDIENFEKQLTKELHKSEGESTITISLINMGNMHLKSNGPIFMKRSGSLSILQTCIGLSLILMLVASINFINLNIAQSAKRAKEVGVRKSLGATKGQLVSQFLAESFLVVILSALLAFTIVEMSLPAFNQMMDRSLSLDYSSKFMLITLVVIFVVGLLSGLYPALFIASFSAKRVLSGDLVRGGTAIFVRKLTLCLQGALSVGLIIGAISLYQQISLIGSLAVGYEKPSRLVIKDLPTKALYTQKHNSLLAEIRNLHGVEQVTFSNVDLTNDIISGLFFIWPNGERLRGPQPTVGTGYYPVETLGLKLLAGRDFSPEFSGDWYQENDEQNSTVSVLVSRRMMELAGYQSPESVIGLILSEPSLKMTAKIVGVIENVKIGSARQESLPVSFNLGFSENSIAKGNIIIKANNADMAMLTSQVRQIVQQELHLSDVQITTVADDYANAHINEHRVLEMVSVFSFLAIFLTCLGTFGLASFATLRRQKEVAIRKVLGASRLSIVNLLAKEFLLLVVISIVIAYPLSYWLIDNWLANFNERIDQTFWIYLVAAAFITMITWLTVASLAFKTASIRPSLILRDE
jgi:putative ABC transport system permease protein